MLCCDLQPFLLLLTRTVFGSRSVLWVVFYGTCEQRMYQMSDCMGGGMYVALQGDNSGIQIRKIYGKSFTEAEHTLTVRMIKICKDDVIKMDII